MGREDDYSGLSICITAIIASGVAVGVSLGRRGSTVAGRLRNKTRIRCPDFVGTIVVAALTVIVCLVISTVPALMLALPDC
jgi:hypothetical protein